MLNQQEWRVQTVFRMCTYIRKKRVEKKRRLSAKLQIRQMHFFLTFSLSVCGRWGARLQRRTLLGLSKTHIIYMIHSCRCFGGMHRVNRDSNRPLIQFARPKPKRKNKDTETISKIKSTEFQCKVNFLRSFASNSEGAVNAPDTLTTFLNEPVKPCTLALCQSKPPLA